MTKAAKPTIDLIETMRTDQQLLWARELARRVYEGIAKVFMFPIPCPGLCSPTYCDYYSICMGGV